MRLPQPVSATNAVLVITSAYDRGVSTSPRNVQVIEVICFERALPGTFADWALHQFTDSQLADPAIGGALGDPDGDRVDNLLEFAMVGDPSIPDAAVAALQTEESAPGTFAFAFRERKSLGDVQRRFETSTNLVHWAEISPSSLVTLTNLPEAYVREAVFPAQTAAAFFRVTFFLP